MRANYDEKTTTLKCLKINYLRAFKNLNVVICIPVLCRILTLYDLTRYKYVSVEIFTHGKEKQNNAQQ